MGCNFELILKPHKHTLKLTGTQVQLYPWTELMFMEHFPPLWQGFD